LFVTVLFNILRDVSRNRQHADDKHVLR